MELMWSSDGTSSMIDVVAFPRTEDVVSNTVTALLAALIGLRIRVFTDRENCSSYRYNFTDSRRRAYTSLANSWTFLGDHFWGEFQSRV